MKSSVVISATGIYAPEHSISNEELVTSFNRYIDKHNQTLDSTEPPLPYSSADFILKASGIQKRYVIDKEGILDIDVMRPKIKQRPSEEPSVQCDMAIRAALQALENAKLSGKDVDFLLVSSSVMERFYPAISIEVQNALGMEGFAFDMNAACSSAAFGVQTAVQAILQGNAKTVLMVNPELCTAHVNFRDRDSHFIFGDACSAIVFQRENSCKSAHPFRILDTRLRSQFSNNIRNNFGVLTPLDPQTHHHRDKMFMQQGRKVFKEVVPWVSDMVLKHLEDNNIEKANLKRLWLHQANTNMNRLIANKILDREPEFLDAPTILNEYGNTGSPGSVIAFHKYHNDLQSGDIGLLCAFGAGYSVGNIILEKI